MSSYAGSRGEALPWGLVLVEGIVLALLGLVLLVAPGASLSFLVWLLGIYLLIAGIFRIIGILLDSSSWGWKLARGFPGYASGRCGPDSRFPRGWLGDGSLVRARYPLGPFLGDQPPDGGGDTNANPGDLHAHRGRGGGGSGVQDA